MILGTVLVLGALSLFAFNQMENNEAGKSVDNILPQVVERIGEPASDAENGGEETPPSVPDPYDPEMTEVEIDGYGYIGYISIPSVSLELPVMSQWDYPRLKIAPCRYAGSTKTNNLVLCAHNYDRHFGPIRILTPGDEVFFTDMDGRVWSYEVETVEVLQPTDIEEMTDGGYDLTLFTCTYGGATRVTVRCGRVIAESTGEESDR